MADTKQLTVGELIEKLQEIDKKLPVHIAISCVYCSQVTEDKFINIVVEKDYISIEEGSNIY